MEKQSSDDLRTLLERIPASGSYEAPALAKQAVEKLEKTIWTQPKFTKEELDQKTVEFYLPTDGHWVYGVGHFWVRRNPEGLLAIEIVTDQQGRNWAERVQTRYFVPQAGVERICPHPDPAKADFLLDFR